MGLGGTLALQLAKGVRMAGRDARQHTRLPVFLECKVEGSSGLALMRLSDLSVSGCYVDTRIPVQVGTPVTVAVTLSGSPLRLTGRVAHTHTGVGFGLKFEGLAEECEVAVRHFVDGLEYSPH